MRMMRMRSLRMRMRMRNSRMMTRSPFGRNQMEDLGLRSRRVWRQRQGQRQKR
jgi:hypothetical protein